MNVLIWHTHGSWMTNFVQGRHTYVVPVEPHRGPDGRGRAQTWDWPETVVERTANELADTELDVVIVQSQHQLELADQWLGLRRRRLPTIWLEHNTPQGAINEMFHPTRECADITVVHVTATNALFWDTGEARTFVIEHGVIDPGERWTGEVPRTAVVINEPLRRWRVTGSDLLAEFGKVAGVDLFGLGAEPFAAALDRPCWLAPQGEPRQDVLHDQLAARRCYLHPFRWTSLGLSLIEAMMLGMPVVALATTAVPDSVPATCGVVSNDVHVLCDAVSRFHDDPERAHAFGSAARRHALDRFSLDRFLGEWDQVLETI
jgi:glycosyltransferase involved in cell wall biosynthesis